MSNGNLNWIANFIWGIADDVLRDDKGAEGLGFMRVLIDHCAGGERRQFRLAPFQYGARVRLRVLRIS